jgi:hypothetical protein
VINVYDIAHQSSYNSFNLDLRVLDPKVWDVADAQGPQVKGPPQGALRGELFGALPVRTLRLGGRAIQSFRWRQQC